MDWVLALRELGNAHAGVGKAEEDLTKELAKLDSAAQVRRSLFICFRVIFFAHEHLTPL